MYEGAVELLRIRDDKNNRILPRVIAETDANEIGQKSNSWQPIIEFKSFTSYGSYGQLTYLEYRSRSNNGPFHLHSLDKDGPQIKALDLCNCDIYFASHLHILMCS